MFTQRAHYFFILKRYSANILKKAIQYNLTVQLTIIDKLLCGLLFLTLLSACSPSIELRESEYVLSKLDFEGNKKVYSEELEEVIPLDQRPNSRPLNLPITPRVSFYNYGKRTFNSSKVKSQLTKLEDELAQYPSVYVQDNRIENKKQNLKRKINKKQESLEEGIGWFWRNIGEPIAEINANQAKNTSDRLTKYLRDIGFKDAKVDYKIDSLLSQRGVRLTYMIEEGSPYLIDSVVYFTEDKKLDSLFNAHEKQQVVRAGDRFDIRLVTLEKSRLERLAKNHGYYNFISKFIEHGADNTESDLATFQEEKHGYLYFETFNPPNKDKQVRYKIGEIVFKAFDPYSNTNNTRLDTTEYQGIKYITTDNSVPLKLLATKIPLSTGELYNYSKILETQRQISLLNQFAFANSQVNPFNEDSISLEFFAPLLEKYSIGTGPGLNHLQSGAQGFFGFGIPFTLTARNWTRRMELFDANFRAFWEGQPSPIDATDIRGSLELGANFSVTYPNIGLLGKSIKKLSLLSPQTQIGAGINYSEPFWGNRLNFRLNTSYSWRPSANKTWFFSLLDANLINTNYNLQDPEGAGSIFYNSLLEQQARGNNLKVTFDPQFVSSFNWTYIYNDQNPQAPYSSSKYFRVFLESGGTLMNFGQNKDRIDLIERVFPLRQDFNSPDTVRAYFRFVKVNVDYRRYINLTPISSFAYRVNVGVTNPYGENRSLPFEKNFFAGGSNSIRAWSPRALGVGSALPDTAAGNVIPQPGDIILEGSFEWRRKVGRLIGDIQFATFIDYGNIWKWYQVETPEKVNRANFDFSRFYKEFAVGTGFGLRLDLSFFLARLDWGIKVVDPSRPEGDRFVLDEFSLRRNQPYGVQFNIGIGYPF